MHNDFDRVECDQVSGVFYGDITRFSQYFASFVRLHPAGAGDPHRYGTHTTFVLHDTTDSSRFWTRNGYGVAVCLKERVELLLHEVGIGVTQSFDLGDDTVVVPTATFLLGCPRTAVQALELATALL